MFTNAQVALQAAAQIHQKVAAGSGAGAGGGSYSSSVKGDIKIDRSSPDEVVRTADVFLDWLNRQDTL